MQRVGRLRRFIGFLCGFHFVAFPSFGRSQISSYLIKMALARCFRFGKIFAYGRGGEAWPRLEKSLLNCMDPSGSDGAESGGMKKLNKFYSFGMHYGIAMSLAVVECL